MKYNFDEIVNRWNTDSIKYDGPEKELNGNSFIPMWVADMDFKTPQPILDSIQERVNHGVLGYTFPSNDWSKAIINWNKSRYDWDISEEEILFTPGIVRGITFALRCFTKPKDRVLVMSPVYPPFFNVPTVNKREVVYNTLLIEDGQYKIDFDQLDKDLQGCKMFILCNPHNPGGTVWTLEELQQIASLCKKNNVLVVSDEIHADLTLPAYEHNTFAKVSVDAEQNSIVFMSPSKTFNMAGLGSSYAVIKNNKLRDQYREYVEALDVVSSHMFSYTPLIAAYEKCNDWLDQALVYIQKNIDYVESFLATHTPLIKMIKPQASFLIFLDCRKLNLSDEELKMFFEERAGLLLNPGVSFGKSGSGFMRLNIGCSKMILEKAMHQLAKAYDELA